MNTKKIATSIIALAIFKEVISKNLLGITLILLCIFLTGCGDATSIGIIGGADGPTSIIVAKKGEKTMYEQITAEDAKKIMDSGEEHIILDTRE